MWCANCHADVAAEVTADHRRVRCASCGTEIATPRPLQTSGKTREARALLQRWSSERLLDPYGPLLSREAPSAPEGSEAGGSTRAQSAAGSGTAREPASTSGPVFRLDEAHPSGPAPKSPDALRGDSAEASSSRAGQPPDPDSPPPSRDSGPTATQAPAGRPADPRGREDHAHLLAGPHFDIRSAIEAQQRPARANWMALAGQMLAYLGVGGLTVGTTLVLWGYFGGPADYTPTGWLIATAGQMLLFLGVVTLVSGGMEQTTDEVSRRIDRLGERLVRIEQAAHRHALRGPDFSPEAARDPDAPRQVRRTEPYRRAG